jgi:dolichol kinase
MAAGYHTPSTQKSTEKSLTFRMGSLIVLAPFLDFSHLKILCLIPGY